MILFDEPLRDTLLWNDLHVAPLRNGNTSAQWSIWRQQCWYFCPGTRIHVLLHVVSLEAEPCPTQTGVPLSVTVEIIGFDAGLANFLLDGNHNDGLDRPELAPSLLDAILQTAICCVLRLDKQCPPLHGDISPGSIQLAAPG